MKKAYLISWIGSIFTFFLSFIMCSVVASKFGESPYNHKKITLHRLTNDIIKITEYAFKRI